MLSSTHVNHIAFIWYILHSRAQIKSVCIRHISSISLWHYMGKEEERGVRKWAWRPPKIRIELLEGPATSSRPNLPEPNWIHSLRSILYYMWLEYASFVVDWATAKWLEPLLLFIKRVIEVMYWIKNFLYLAWPRFQGQRG